MNNKNKSDEKDIRTTVYLPKLLHKHLKMFAAETDTSASEIVRQAVEQYIAQKVKVPAVVEPEPSTAQ